MPYKDNEKRNARRRIVFAQKKTASSTASIETVTYNETDSVISDLSHHSSSHSSREEILEDKVKQLEEALAQERENKIQFMAETQKHYLKLWRLWPRI